MNWVAPIKDDTTLEKFKQKLREVDDKYYILFEIGVVVVVGNERER